MKFSPKVMLLLGCVLAAAEAAQLQVTMSVQAHSALTLVITVLSGLGVLAASKAQVAKEVPHQVLVAATAAIGALNVIQTSFGISTTLRTVIAVVLVIANTLLTSNGEVPTGP